MTIADTTRPSISFDAGAAANGSSGMSSNECSCKAMQAFRDLADASPKAGKSFSRTPNSFASKGDKDQESSDVYCRRDLTKTACSVKRRPSDGFAVPPVPSVQIPDADQAHRLMNAAVAGWRRIDLRNNSAGGCRCRKTPFVLLRSDDLGDDGAEIPGSRLRAPRMTSEIFKPMNQGDATMRFMMLMIPEGYETAAPGTMPSAEAVAAMMKYNEALKDGRRADHARRAAPAVDGRAGFVRRRQAGGDRRSLHRGQGSARRLLDDRREVAGGGDRLGQALPGFQQRDHRNPPGAGNVGFPRRCSGSGGRI